MLRDDRAQIKEARSERFVRGNAGRVLLSQRRLRILSELVACAQQAQSEVEACAAAVATLGKNARDVAFALIYLLDPDQKRARLAGATQLMNGATAPAIIELDKMESAWQALGQTAETGAAQRLTGLDALLGPTLALAIAPPGQTPPTGFLLAGLSPQLVFDDDYRGFLELAAGNIGAAVEHLRADEEKRKRAQSLAEVEGSRRELAMMRREVEAVLNDSKRRRSEFFSNMSHEIRSPMTAILGYSEILLLHLQDPDDVECVKTIKQSGNYLLEIINDILDLSKIEAGKLRINKEKVALPSLLLEIQSLMTVRAKEKGLPMILECQGDLPEIVETDRARLRQVVINLVSNAIKFTESGGIRLIAKFQADQRLLQIDVVDTGIGIAPELQGGLFDAFMQADSSAARRYGGTGLGLAISKRLVEILDGAITMKSTPGQGSTFTVVIPVPTIDGAAWRDFSENASSLSRTNATLHGCRVLVADDWPDIRYLVRQFLEDAGAEVITAASGLAAIDDIQKINCSDQEVDLVVMDMAMPGVDGYETTRRLRDRGFDKPIIALTAAAAREDRERCLRAGCAAYLTKPVDRQALVELVAHYAGECKASGANQHAGGTEKPVLKILLVDDHRSGCQSMARLLEMSGNEVRTAFDGNSAIAAARDFNADAVILDINLPDMNGYELLERLREQAGLRRALSIALTGYSEDMRSQDATVKFDHFLVKPIDIAHLEALLS